jgi:hypothetical protein
MREIASVVQRGRAKRHDTHLDNRKRGFAAQSELAQLSRCFLFHKINRRDSRACGEFIDTE